MNRVRNGRDAGHGDRAGPTTLRLQVPGLWLGVANGIEVVSTVPSARRMLEGALDDDLNEWADKLSDTHLDETDKSEAFERLMMPHLDSAHNLARWLTGNDHDAQDIVQEAYLRAYRHFDGYRGGDAHAWILTIIRNTCYSWLKKNRAPDAAEFDEETHSSEDSAADPRSLLIQSATVDSIREAMEALPTEFREILVLRELEGLSYKQISEAVAVPIGTVMSRIARARGLLQRRLLGRESKEKPL